MGKTKAVTPFYVGDLVTWSSQASGVTKKKTGTVIEVVPPRMCPKAVRNLGTRFHESYVVEVTHKPKRSRGAIKAMRTKKPDRYWPVVANLTRVRSGKTADVDVSAQVEDPAPVAPAINGADFIAGLGADNADVASVESGAN